MILWCVASWKASDIPSFPNRIIDWWESKIAKTVSKLWDFWVWNHYFFFICVHWECLMGMECCFSIEFVIGIPVWSFLLTFLNFEQDRSHLLIERQPTRRKFPRSCWVRLYSRRWNSPSIIIFWIIRLKYFEQRKPANGWRSHHIILSSSFWFCWMVIVEHWRDIQPFTNEKVHTNPLHTPA